MERTIQNGVYFDAVLLGGVKPVFNGTREETVQWLGQNPEEFNKVHLVCVGKTLALVTVAEYLEMA